MLNIMGFNVEATHPLGLYALLALIPLIIIYLTKPKPVDENVPSISFFLKDTGLARQNAFLRRLLRNLLLLIQMLIIAVMAYSLAYPVMLLPRNMTAENTAIVIDLSASSQTAYHGSSRFERERELALDNLGARNSIIAVTNTPLLLAKDVSTEEARRLISNLKPRDTTSAIGGSILLASELISRGDTIVVVSDFSNNQGTEVAVAERIADSRGINTALFDVSSEAENTGIIDMRISRDKTALYVKNYCEAEKIITLEMENPNLANSTQQTRRIAPRSLEVYEFETLPGRTVFRLYPEDALEADNYAYLSFPAKKVARTLLITNSKKSFLENALLSSKNVRLEVARPPVIPKLEYDIVVMHEVSVDMLLPGFLRDLKNAVGNGTSLITTAQPELARLEQELLPVSVNYNLVNQTLHVNKLLVNEFTKHVDDFGMLRSYVEASAKENALTIADVTGDDNVSVPLIALGSYGSGKTVYYGILENHTDFIRQPAFPIFWSELVSFLIGQKDYASFNLRTGTRLRTDSGVTDVEKAGFYAIGEKTIAANILSEGESDVNSASSYNKGDDFVLKSGESSEGLSLTPHLILAAITLLITEILYLKLRGEL